MAIAGIVFLALFTVDGSMSVAEEILRSATGSVALVPTRNLVALATVRAAPVAAVLCACSPRLPTKVYAVPVAATFWLALGALPVPMWVEPALVAPLLCAFQLGVAGFAWGALALAVRRSGGLRTFAETGPAFAPKRLAAFAAAGALALPVAAAGYGALLAAYWIEVATDGFIDVHAGGLWIAERRYVDHRREVHLIGMMHIGEPGAYDELFDSFTGESTLVLEEGVTDRHALLSNPLGYGKAAAALGLDAQGSVSEYFDEAQLEFDGDDDEPLWPDVRHADVDVSDFSPSTIAFIERAGRVWSSDEPIAAFLAILSAPPSNEELDLFFREIIAMRNERVLAEIARAEQYRRVIVPWGALHLPGIERAIEERGFVRAEETQRQLVSWSTILAAVRQDDPIDSRFSTGR